MRALIVTFLFISVLAARAQTEAGVTNAQSARLANGIAIEGTIKQATDQGLIIETSKGTITYPWKYLSAGTRYRYQRPLLSSTADARSNAAGRQASGASQTNVTSNAADKSAAEKQTAK